MSKTLKTRPETSRCRNCKQDFPFWPGKEFCDRVCKEAFWNIKARVVVNDDDTCDMPRLPINWKDEVNRNDLIASISKLRFKHPLCAALRSWVARAVGDRGRKQQKRARSVQAKRAHMKKVKARR